MVRVGIILRIVVRSELNTSTYHVEVWFRFMCAVVDMGIGCPICPRVEYCCLLSSHRLRSILMRKHRMAL